MLFLSIPLARKISDGCQPVADAGKENLMDDIESILRDNLKAIVRAYAKATGRSIPAVSKQLYGNSNVLGEFFSGAPKCPSMSIRKMSEILESMRDNWPEGAEWPLCRAAIMSGPRRREKSSSKSPTKAA
jgi:hypothetical protein